MLEDVGCVELGMLLIVRDSVLAIVLNQIDVESLCISLDALVIEVHNLLIDCHILKVWNASNELSEAHNDGLDACWIIVGDIHGIIGQFIE